MKKLILTAAFVGFSFDAAAAPGPGAGGPKSPPGPGYHEVTVATVAGQGEPVESKVLLETPHLKLASVILRQGATLSEHKAPMQVTIQAVAGAGTVKLGDKTVRIETGKMVVLAPNMPHAVVADEKTDLIILVHHLLGGGPGGGRGPR